LLLTRPSVIWRSSTHPTSVTTSVDRSSVLITTRAWMERRHTVTARCTAVVTPDPAMTYCAVPAL
jgi:hypothetical protein